MAILFLKVRKKLLVLKITLYLKKDTEDYNYSDFLTEYKIKVLLRNILTILVILLK